MSFRVGWYEIQFDARTYRKRCRYFKSTSAYVAECDIEGNGAQILLWQDPQFTEGPGRAAAWQESYRPLPVANAGDWWDNPPGGDKYRPSNPGFLARGSATLFAGAFPAGCDRRRQRLYDGLREGDQGRHLL